VDNPGNTTYMYFYIYDILDPFCEVGPVQLCVTLLSLHSERGLQDKKHVWELMRIREIPRNVKVVPKRVWLGLMYNYLQSDILKEGCKILLQQKQSCFLGFH